LSRLIRSEDAADLEVVRVTWQSGNGTAARIADVRLSPHVHGSLQSRCTELEARIAQLETELRLRTAEAHDRGERTGLAAAAQEFERETRPVIEAVAREIESIRDVRRKLEQQAETQLLQLAVAIARRILHRELTLDPAALNGIVEAALRKLYGEQLLRVRVHPKLEAALRMALVAHGVGDIEVAAESKAASAALVFETERGALDASIETQLDEIRRGLADHLGR
jgi:flagellar assembly protein FliH